MNNLVRNNKKFRLSYCIPQAILNDLKEKMISQHYDLKGKSKWISEAVHDLLDISNYCELVNISDHMNNLGKMDSVSIDQELKLKLEQAIIQVRKHFPAIEGVQSKILRTAILQRLLR